MKHTLALFFLFSSFAFAAGNGSEFNWQAPAGKFELKPGLDFSRATIEPKNFGDSKISGPSISISGEYGFSEMWSGGVELATDNFKTEPPAPATSTKQTGLRDPNLYIRGRVPMAGGSLRFGAELGVSLSKSITEANGDTNSASGGMSLLPYVGYEVDAAPSVYGARLSFRLPLGDRTEEDKGQTPPAESKTSDGRTAAISLFYEHDMAPAKLGVALQISSTEKVEWKDSSGAISARNAGFTTAALKLYAPYEVNHQVTILPEFAYLKYTAFDTTNIDSITQWTLGLAARFAF